MKQNKSTFIFDNFIEINGEKDLNDATGMLNLMGITYAVEPWGEDEFRIYCRKDVAMVLEGTEKALKDTTAKPC